MSVHLSFDIEGERQVSAELGIMADHVEDWSPALTRVGSTLLKSFDLNFNSRGQLFQGGGWPRRKTDRSWPLLEKTGSMRKAFDKEQGGDYVMLFNNSSYFKYHQSNKPRRVLPRRIMMKIDEIRRREIFKIFQAHIVHGTKARFK